MAAAEVKENSKTQNINFSVRIKQTKSQRDLRMNFQYPKSIKIFFWLKCKFSSGITTGCY